jgi:hypothetical protein
MVVKFSRFETSFLWDKCLFLSWWKERQAFSLPAGQLIIRLLRLNLVYVGFSHTFSRLIHNLQEPRRISSSFGQFPINRAKTMLEAQVRENALFGGARSDANRDGDDLEPRSRAYATSSTSTSRNVIVETDIRLS